MIMMYGDPVGLAGMANKISVETAVTMVIMMTMVYMEAMIIMVTMATIWLQGYGNHPYKVFLRNPWSSWLPL